MKTSHLIPILDAARAGKTLLPQGIRGNGFVTLVWQPVTGATKYKISIIEDDGDVTVVSDNITGTAYNVTGLTNNTEYTFVIQWFDGSAWSSADPINYITATPGGNAVIPPLPIATPGDEQVTLTWDAVTGADMYAVSVYDGSYTVLVADLTETTYTITGLTNDVKYSFLVQSHVGTRWSSQSTLLLVNATPHATTRRKKK